MPTPKKGSTDAPKSVTVTLTYGAIDLLKQVLPTAWSEDWGQMVRVAGLLENELDMALDEPSPKPPKVDRNDPDAPAAIEAHNERYAKWEVKTSTFDIPVKAYDDIKACLEVFKGKKAFVPTKHIVCLAHEFELVKE
jgi:hypothetical protein